MTPKKKTIAKPVLPKQEIRQSADFESIYANWMQATFSPHEMSLIVGQSFQTAPGVPVSVFSFYLLLARPVPPGLPG